MWKHYNIGEGTVIALPKASSKPVIKLDIIEAPVTLASARPLHYREQVKMLICKECSKTFFSQSEYDEHMEMGWHDKPDLAGETVWDSVKKRWCQLVTGISASGKILDFVFCHFTWIQKYRWCEKHLSFTSLTTYLLFVLGTISTRYIIITFSDCQKSWYIHFFKVLFYKN